MMIMGICERYESTEPSVEGETDPKNPMEHMTINIQIEGSF